MLFWGVHLILFVWIVRLCIYYLKFNETFDPLAYQQKRHGLCLSKNLGKHGLHKFGSRLLHNVFCGMFL